MASRGDNHKMVVESYSEVAKALATQGFHVIGVDYYVDQAQADGDRPPDWRLANRLDHAKPHNIGAESPWAFIAAYRGATDHRPTIQELAGRINFAIRSCKYRLRQISEAYAAELTGVSRQKKTPDEGQLFATGNTEIVLFSIHAFFMEASILRDNFAEFISRFVFPEHPDSSSITTFKSLRSKILKKVKDKSDLARVLLEISEQERVPGWLGSLGVYRDFVCHVTPLVNLGRASVMRFSVFKARDGATFPFVNYPIPTVADLQSDNLFAEPGKADVESVVRAARALVERGGIDALTYCSEALVQLLGLANQLLAHSPITPEMPVLTEEDLR